MCGAVLKGVFPMSTARCWQLPADGWRLKVALGLGRDLTCRERQ